MEAKWELIIEVCDCEVGGRTSKMKVEGGWLYLHRTINYMVQEETVSESMCFVPERK